MDEMEFKSFDKTYRKIALALIMTGIFPNPKTDIQRIIGMMLLTVSASPLCYMILINMFQCWMDKDFINAIRHSTVLGPFLAGFFKMILLFHKRTQAKEVIDEITRDHLLSNDPHYKYKDIVRAAIRNSQIYSQNGWVVIVLVCVMSFPTMAILLNTYNFLFKWEPVKYMIHDFNLPNLDTEKKFESPYFEFVFAYSFYCAVLYALNFIGYDGFFGISTNHACLKINILCAELEDAMKSDSKEVYHRVVTVIKEQCRMFKYVSLIQDTFNIWLGVIFIATMIQICTCLYIITEGYGFDVRYMIFVLGGVIHIYLPCRYASKLKAMSLETADKIYCCGWEHVEDRSVKQFIIFMIAKAQIPIQISAFNMINFDMDLFLSIMQTSYSTFTLLRS